VYIEEQAKPPQHTLLVNLVCLHVILKCCVCLFVFICVFDCSRRCVGPDAVPGGPDEEAGLHGRAAEFHLPAQPCTPAGQHQVSRGALTPGGGVDMHVPGEHSSIGFGP